MNTKRFTVNLLLLGALLVFLLSPLGILRFLAMLCFLYISFAYVQVMLGVKSIEIERVESTYRGIKNQQFSVTLKIRNNLIFPLHSVKVYDTRGALVSESSAFILSLSPREERYLTYSCTGPSRGRYILGPVVVKGSDLFGVFHWERRFPVTGEAVVYPEILPVELGHDRGLPAGTIPVNNRLYEDVTQFRAIRDYQPGDDLKRINWKVSARTGELQSMEFESSLYYPVVLVLNRHLPDYPHRYREFLVERAITAAASAVFYYTALKLEVGLYSPSETEDSVIIPPRQGLEHALQILEALAVMKPQEGRLDLEGLFYRSGKLFPTGAKVLYIGPQAGPGDSDIMMDMKRRGYQMEQIEVRQESAPDEENAVKGIVKIIPLGLYEGEIHG